MHTDKATGVAADGAHIQQNHAFGRPAPGSGTMRICKSCGEKETAYTVNAECVGRPATGVTETIHDYDPIG